MSSLPGSCFLGWFGGWVFPSGTQRGLGRRMQFSGRSRENPRGSARTGGCTVKPPDIWTRQLLAPRTLRTLVRARLAPLTSRMSASEGKRKKKKPTLPPEVMPAGSETYGLIFRQNIHEFPRARSSGKGHGRRQENSFKTLPRAQTEPSRIRNTCPTPTPTWNFWGLRQPVPGRFPKSAPSPSQPPPNGRWDARRPGRGRVQVPAL